jgi:tripartite ATP-independent transporter DctM subunit
MIAATAIGLFVILAILGSSIAISLLAGGVAYLALVDRVPLHVVAQRVGTGLDSFSYLAIPFFILAADLMNRAGITDRLFRLARAVVGHIRGGLGYVNVLTSMGFATMSGSAVADAAGLGKIQIQAMEKEGYDRDFAAAITGASATIGPVIPPSISLVIYGLTAGVSIGALFLAGIVPGLLMGLFLMGMVYYYAVKRNYPVHTRANFRELLLALRDSALALFTPIIVVGGIIFGIFTATEAGAFAVFYALILGLFIYRTIHPRDLPEILLENALVSANVLFIIAVTALVGWVLTLERVPTNLAMWVAGNVAETWIFLLGVNVLLFFLGMFMASQAVIVMMVPVLLPVAVAMEVDPVHLGVIMVMNLMIGLLTPPVGLVLYVVADIAKMSIVRLSRILLPFMFVLILALLITTYVPAVVLWLPRLFNFMQ